MGISWTEISPGEASAKINRANFAKNYGRFFSLEQATTKLPGRCIKVRFACMSRILCCFAEILLVELFVDRLAHSILAFACILPPWPIAESQDEKTAFAWTCATLFPIKWFAHHIDVYIRACVHAMAPVIKLQAYGKRGNEQAFMDSGAQDAVLQES